MKAIYRRIGRLEGQLGLVEMTVAEREASARTMACLVNGTRRYAAWMGRDLTPDEQRQIDELERPLEARQHCARLSLEEVTEALERGRGRAAASAN